MFPRLLIFVALVAIAGCAAREPKPEEQAMPEPVVEPIVEVIEAPVVAEDPLPGACEILLMRLEETQPLLSNLDASLAGQVDRIEQAAARINTPEPAPRASDCPTVSTGALGRKEIIGAIEWIYMNPPADHFRARVDSGVETSSLSAKDVVEFERDGDDWVRFTFDHEETDTPVDFELPIKRVVLVRQPPYDDPDRRVVVELDIRLGEQLQATEFTLTNRSSMTYPVLLGRAFLMDLYVVDVSQTYTHEKYKAQ